MLSNYRTKNLEFDKNLKPSLALEYLGCDYAVKLPDYAVKLPIHSSQILRLNENLNQFSAIIWTSLCTNDIML